MGTEVPPPPHPICRNSWGVSWGIRGYAYVTMTGDNTNGACAMYYEGGELLLGRPVLLELREGHGERAHQKKKSRTGTHLGSREGLGVAPLGYLHPAGVPSWRPQPANIAT